MSANWCPTILSFSFSKTALYKTISNTDASFWTAFFARLFFRLTGSPPTSSPLSKRAVKVSSVACASFHPCHSFLARRHRVRYPSFSLQLHPPFSPRLHLILSSRLHTEFSTPLLSLPHRLLRVARQSFPPCTSHLTSPYGVLPSKTLTCHAPSPLPSLKSACRSVQSGHLGP